MNLRFSVNTSGINFFDSTSVAVLHEYIRETRSQHNISSNKIINQLNKFIKQGYDINEVDSRGYTPLACAATHSYKMNLDVIRFLLENGANPNFNYNGSYVIAGALYLYVTDGFNEYSSDETIKEYLEIIEPSIIATIKLLIDHGADLNLKININQQSLYYRDHHDAVTIYEYIKLEQERMKRNDQVVSQLENILTYYDARKKPVQQLS